jgi:hypothetical protein
MGSVADASLGHRRSIGYGHDPANADERKRDAAKAGRSIPNVELKEIKTSIKDLTERVLRGGGETGPAAIANQLINMSLRIIELERRWKETGSSKVAWKHSRTC